MASTFAGGLKRSHPGAPNRRGGPGGLPTGAGASTLSASTPFTGNASGRLRGTSFAASSAKPGRSPSTGSR